MTASLTGGLSANPLRQGLRLERTPKPAILTIFGASGDLTVRKLIPALYDLARDRRLPPEFTVVGYARRPYSHEEFREILKEGVAKYSRSKLGNLWESFSKGIYYFQGDLDNLQNFKDLGEFLQTLDSERGTLGNRAFYMATAPSFFAPIIENLGGAGLAGDVRNTRLVIEKPFGHDLESAQNLNKVVQQVFHEKQVYRIDHYLGKETVQNILVFRFANSIWEPLWNNRYVDHVQITVAETVGVENRGPYYDEAGGALRDMIQNHLMQLLALTAMEPPSAFEADTVRDEKVKVLRATQVGQGPNGLAAVRAQYANGWISGEPVPAYRDEPRVNPDVKTASYIAAKFTINNWRWNGVPFFLRTGKRLAKRVSEIALQFREVPHLLFPSSSAGQLNPNMLVLRIQPDEGISLRFEAKRPVADIAMRSVNMDFHYGGTFEVASPEAYERLLLDFLLGDQTLFTRADEVEAAWKIVTPLIERWEIQKASDLNYYDAGSWGPSAASKLMDNGRRWRRL
ncbi:glucose-6-phosphate dehydrogenase [Gloeobacter morelensis]|uniref:Glucose-6-phosphate 1-dehydrogenase n=1 Tax=Gloeobacter morelensis MG652769 TaxID=2781736 RepID=A0ABY3PR66_9CYAN|nr:glucose-6-phosphate dehydrogenase [Gloeobacter morelensis]UFP96132.1 glucose-6-phosphate dehydrogenase [Gloeobacter morelensis MG652769]